MYLIWAMAARDLNKTIATLLKIKEKDTFNYKGVNNEIILNKIIETNAIK